MMDFYQKVGKLIKDARVKRGLRQKDIAATIGLARSSVSNIERGGFVHHIEAENLAKIAMILDIDLNEIKNLTEDMGGKE